MAEKVAVYNRDGVFGTLDLNDESELQAAIAEGFRVASPEEQKNEQLKYIASGPVGKVAAATTSALDAASFGASDYLVQKFFPEAFEIVEAAREENPISSGVGTAAGMVGSVASPLAKAATKVGEKAAVEVAGIVGSGVAGKAAQTAAKLGAEGLAVSSPLAISQAVLGDVDEAGETLMYGSFGSAAAGGSVSLVGSAAKAGANRLAQFLKPATSKVAGAVANTLEKQEVYQGAKALGFNKSMIAKAGIDRTRELVQFAKDRDLFKLTQSAVDDLKAVEALRKAEGEKIGQVFKNIDSSGKYFVDGTKLLDRIKQGVQIPRGELLAPERNAYNKALKDVLLTVTNKSGAVKEKIKFRDLQRLKSNLGDYAYNDFAQVRPGRKLVAKIERLVDETIDDSLDWAERSYPDQAAIWRDAKLEYRGYSDLIKPLKNRMDSEMGNQLVRPSNIGFAAAGAAAGGGPGMILGYALNEARQTYGAKAATLILGKVNSLINSRNNVISKGVNRYFDLIGKVPDGVRPVALGEVTRSLDEKQSRSLEDVRELSRTLAEDISANPDRLSSAVEDIAGVDDALSSTVQQRLIAAAEHLRQHVPKPNRVGSPFLEEIYAPSDKEVASFERRLAVALDPHVVIGDLQNGTLSTESIDTLKQLYPHFHRQLSQTIVDTAATRKKKLSFEQRVQLSYILGTEFDEVLKPENVALFQKNFAVSQQENQRKTGKRLEAPNLATDVERITNR